MYWTTKAPMTCSWQRPPKRNNSHLFKSICVRNFTTARLLEKEAHSALKWHQLSQRPCSQRAAHFYKLSQVSQPVLPSSYRLRYRLSMLLLFILSAVWISITMPGVIVVLASESWGHRESLNSLLCCTDFRGRWFSCFQGQQPRSQWEAVLTWELQCNSCNSESMACVGSEGLCS